MNLKDLIVAPILLLIVFTIGLILIRFIDKRLRKTFIYGLSLKIIGAITVGLIYQFYYNGGDTFNYFHEAKIINQALGDSFENGILLYFSNGSYNPSIYNYANQLYWFDAPSEFLTSKITALLGLVTFDTYSGIAVLYAILSFSGLWAFYVTLLSLYPNLRKEFAIAIFYVPSLIFWGSGVLKDAIIIGCIGWILYSLHQIFLQKRNILVPIIILTICLYLVYVIRIYLLFAFLIPCIYWVFMERNKKIKNKFFRILLYPMFLTLSISLGSYFAFSLTEGDTRYDVQNIGKFMKINAEYLYNLSVYQGGSAYYLGEIDDSIIGNLRLAPKAIWVSLFRPYLWESRNFVMLLSALESFVLLLFTIRVIIFKVGPLKSTKYIINNPFLQFSLAFTIIFAFAIGITSFNFGTLVRYKIPIIPFYLVFLFIILHLSKRNNYSAKRIS